MTACGHGACRSQTTQFYLSGWRCPDHTPARLAGRPEPLTLTERGLRPWWVRDDGSVIPPPPLSTSWVHDSRAVASGRRVSGERRRAAHAGEQYDRATPDGAP